MQVGLQVVQDIALTFYTALCCTGAGIAQLVSVLPLELEIPGSILGDT